MQLLLQLAVNPACMCKRVVRLTLWLHVRQMVSSPGQYALFTNLSGRLVDLRRALELLGNQLAPFGVRAGSGLRLCRNIFSCDFQICDFRLRAK